MIMLTMSFMFVSVCTEISSTLAVVRQRLLDLIYSEMKRGFLTAMCDQLYLSELIQNIF